MVRPSQRWRLSQNILGPSGLFSLGIDSYEGRGLGALLRVLLVTGATRWDETVHR